MRQNEPQKMSITSILYSIFIQPIEILIELAYSLIYDRVSNAGISIVGVSLVATIAILLTFVSQIRSYSGRRKREAGFYGRMGGTDPADVSRR